MINFPKMNKKCTMVMILRIIRTMKRRLINVAMLSATMTLMMAATPIMMSRCQMRMRETAISKKIVFLIMGVAEMLRC
jgi:hypothetical protein